MSQRPLPITWARTGWMAGIAAVMSYLLLITSNLPVPALCVLACLFGLLLTAASIGLYHMLAAHRVTATLQFGVLCNVIGAACLVAMLLVQLALHSVRSRPATEGSLSAATWQLVNTVQLGLDVVWDVYFATGTFLFAWNMFRHPRFGPLFASVGCTVALALLALNLMTFPKPPAEAGLFDVGPFVGLWYLAVSLQTARSMKWLEETTG